MKVFRTILFLVLFSQLIVALPPVVIGFFTWAATYVVKLVVKQAVRALIKYGVSVAGTNENEEMKEIALKYQRDPYGLTDEQRDILVKGILMREMLAKLLRVDYECDWRSEHVLLTFDFSYSNGTQITHGSKI